MNAQRDDLLALADEMRSASVDDNHTDRWRAAAGEYGNRLHSILAASLPGPSAPESADPVAWPKVRGCGRDGSDGTGRTLYLCLAERPSDNAVRAIHDALLRHPTPAASDGDAALLGKAIRDAAVAAGICRDDVPLTGPQLVMLCNDMAEDIKRRHSASDGGLREATEAMAHRYLAAQRAYIVEVDRTFGRQVAGALHPDDVIGACMAGLNAAGIAAPPPPQASTPAAATKCQRCGGDGEYCLGGHSAHPSNWRKCEDCTPAAVAPEQVTEDEALCMQEAFSSTYDDGRYNANESYRAAGNALLALRAKGDKS